LYEKHKAISYVGTDCRFLPTSKFADARATLGALGKVFVQQASGASLDIKSKAWNDAKVDEHFAIIPTGVLPQNATPEEKAVFEAVSMRYIAQFYPAFEFVTHRLTAIFGKDEFRATKRETTRMGWKQIEGHLEQGGPRSEESGEEDGQDQVDEDQPHRPKEGGGR
jgi:DNA topoisomerase-3